MNKRRVIKLFFSFASPITAAVWSLRPTVINIESIRKKEEAIPAFSDKVIFNDWEDVIELLAKQAEKDIRRRYYE